MNRLLKNLFFILLSVAFTAGFFAVLPVFGAWTNPSQGLPPAGNTPPPLNSSATAQYKNGTLVISSSTTAYQGNPYQHGLLIPYGRIGIGTTTPSVLAVVDAGPNANALNVGGGRIINLALVPSFDDEAASKAYVDSGVNSIGVWTKLNNNIYNNNSGNVGIGTNNPIYKLEVNTGDTAAVVTNLLLRNSRNNASSGYGVGLKLKLSSDSGNEANKWFGIFGVAGNGLGNRTDLQFHGTPNATTQAPAEVMRITGAGDVGIGNINPQARLVVDGTPVANGDIYSLLEARNNNTAFSGSPRVGLQFYTIYNSASQLTGLGGIMMGKENATDGNYASYLSLITRVNGSTPTEKFRITSSGNVGIGTNAPDTLIHLVGPYDNSASKAIADSNKGLTITSSAAGSANYARGNEFGIVFATNGGGATDYPGAGIMAIPIAASTYVGADLAFQTHTSAENTLLEKMRITSTGNVGIGTAAPSTPLHIFSSSNSVSVNFDGVNSNYGNVYARRSNGATGGTIVAAGDILGAYQSAGWDGAAWKNTGGIAMGAEGTVASSRIPSNIQFYTAANAAGSALTEKMRINSSGNVGIGTNNPGFNLQVYNPNSADAEINIQRSSNSYAAWSSYLPAGALSATNNKWLSGLVGAYDRYVISTWSGTAYTERLTINNSGTVSIASTTAINSIYKLDVKGDIRSSGQIKLGGGDVAEEFITAEDYSAGTVLVMGDSGYKSAKPCAKEYDPTVVGAISDQASVVMGRVDSKYRAVVALTGIIKVRVNSSGGQIKKGNLLTTSAIAGEAMKAGEYQPGTIIGKALENDSGRGWVMALVNLK